MNYIKFNTFSSLLLIILPLCVLSIGSLISEIVGSVVNFKLIFGIVICGLLLNFIHNFGYTNILKYKRTTSDKYPFLYFLPVFGLLVAFCTIIVLSNNSIAESDVYGSIQKHKEVKQSHEKLKIVEEQNANISESSVILERVDYFVPDNESEFSVATQLTNKLKNALANSSQQVKLNESEKELVQNYASLFHSAALKGDWQEFQRLANEAAQKSPDALDGAVNIALMFDGPMTHLIFSEFS